MERSKIIIKLINDEITVIQAMSILKLLLQDCKNEKVLSWIDKEINGYGKNDQLPNYRILNCSIEGNIKSGLLILSHVNIPIKEEYKKYVLNFEVRFGLNSIYQYSIAEESSEKHNLSLDMPLDYINSAVAMNVEVTHARRELGLYAFTNILNDLKPILLNIFIELENKYGNLDGYYIDMNDKKKKQEINQYIINILADNSIKIGDNNRINNSNIGEKNENKNSKK